MDLRVITYDVTYDLRESSITQVIPDDIAEGPEVSRHVIILHSKVLTKADILVFYLSQSVDKQQSYDLNGRLVVRLTRKLENSVVSQ